MSYFFNYYKKQEIDIITGSDKYCIANKEILKENAKNKYRNLLEEEEKEKREYGRNKYRNMTEDKKNKLKEY